MKTKLIIAAMLVAASLANAQMFAQLFGTTSRLPSGYRECNWIASTNALPYINTGIAPTLYGTDVAIDCMTLAANNRVWGCYEVIATVPNRYREYTTSSGLIYLGAAGGQSLNHSISNRAVISVVGKKAFTDGVQKYEYTGADATFTKTIHLFAELEGETVQKGRSRVYSAKIWTSGVLVRDFVPCLNPSNVPGMYDLVGGVFYENAGTGIFSYELK